MELKTCKGCVNDFLAKTSRARFCDTCLAKHLKSDRHIVRPRTTPTFRAVDGEGIGDDYVLLGIGQDQVEWPNGLEDLTELFHFLYSDFINHPKDFYVGFYLMYDWNMWFKHLPLDRIAYLIDPEFIAKRQRRLSPVPFPVLYRGWEFDWLPGKRFKLRPEGSELPWFYLCDAGPFFQMSLLKALRTRSAQSDITDEMVAVIEAGKAKRSSAKLDEEMRLYNRLENRALESLMRDVDHSLSVLGTPLGKTEYHGPGQAAQKWLLAQPGVKEANFAVMELSEEIFQPIVGSYYGGIFETTAHGHVPGTSYEYDINSAYPYQIAQLPCTCGEWKRDTALEVKNAKLRLLHGKFHGSDKWLGPLPFRTPQRKILRPRDGSGWYWEAEIEAAKRAGLLYSFDIDDAVVYLGCPHDNLMQGIRHLYDERIRVGKESTIGKGCKLVYNSAYGKNAQSVGNPQAANAVNASLITSGCRIQILDAIATHPGGTKALLMIATDAVYFTSPHPNLNISGEELGAWDVKEREDLCIFRPGMYWDAASRDAIFEGQSPVFKSRGVRAGDFAGSINQVDYQFEWFANGDQKEWPKIVIPIEFAQISIKQAYHRTKKIKDPDEREITYRELAGRIITDDEREVGSEPSEKRDLSTLTFGDLIRTEPYQGDIELETEPYDARFGKPETPDLYTEELPLDFVLGEAFQLR
jgi:hypothetical protein